MKEHSFFLEVSFTPRDASYIQQADLFRNEFDKLLWEVVSVSNGIVSNDALISGEIVTPYTLNAETASYYYTGIHIPLELTREEMELRGDDSMTVPKSMEQVVYDINDKAIQLVKALIDFKANILKNVLVCKMFTVNYPLLIDHIMREAMLYLQSIEKIQSGEEFDIRQMAAGQESFWDKIMAEHAKFIRGLLDPTEEDLMEAANRFANEFDQLAEKSKADMNNIMPNSELYDETVNATKAIRDFKEKGTQGILECNIKSIIIPLLADHTLREANHYLRLLNIV
jgi:hypothetical protein